MDLNENQTAQTDATLLEGLLSSGTTSSTKITAPSVEVIEGRVLKVDEVTPKEGNPFFLVTVGAEQIVVSRTAMLRDKAILQVGHTVVATCERRVAHKTQYLEEGKLKAHKTSGLSLNKVHLTEDRAVKTAELRDKVAEVTALNGAAIDRASGLAEVFKRYVGDDPMAMATALAGLANVK